jgi:hypothetical protein
MKQTQKLNALISRIIKEELDSRSKGTVDMEVSEKLLKNLVSTNNTDSPVDLKSLNIKKTSDGYYRIMIQSKTPEFAQFKKDFKQVKNYIPGDLEDEYEDVAKAIEKADIEGSVDLIKQGRKSGLEEKLTVASADGKVSGVKNAQAKKDAEAELVKGRAVNFIEPGKTQEASEEEMQEPDMEQKPKASEIAGQLAEIMEKLKSMAEGEDPKKGKHAAKVMKYMESAKAALEALTAHETMLEEKDQAEQEKKAEKHKKNIEKIFKSIVKDENIVNRLKDKLTPKDIAALSKKLGEKGKELDEEKLARIVLNRSLKEGWVKKK